MLVECHQRAWRGLPRQAPLFVGDELTQLSGDRYQTGAVDPGLAVVVEEGAEEVEEALGLERAWWLPSFHFGLGGSTPSWNLRSSRSGGGGGGGGGGGFCSLLAFMAHFVLGGSALRS